jgi:hypothetical protein
MGNKVAIELKEHFEERLMRNLTDKEIAFVSWVAEKSHPHVNEVQKN